MFVIAMTGADAGGVFTTNGDVMPDMPGMPGIG